MARHSRREFMRVGFCSAAAAAALSMEEKTLLAQQQEGGEGEPAAQQQREPVRPCSKASLPTGKIGDVEFSRLMLGGNLIGGWAHARDLMYVSKLLKAYHTDEKVLDTLQLAEEHGITCINTHPNAGRLIQRYRKERGGTIKWMVQAFCDKSGNFAPCVDAAVAQGVDLIHVQGALADHLVKEDKYDWLERGIQYMQAKAVPAGVGAHNLSTMKFCRDKGMQCDFYVKTFHHHRYPTAPKADEITGGHREVPGYWCDKPDDVREFFADLDKPWVAFKVMAAGAIRPADAFRFAWTGGADFIMAGMFDFQVAEDAKIASHVLGKLGTSRKRAWCA